MKNYLVMSKNNFFSKYTPVCINADTPREEALKYPSDYCMFDTMGKEFEYVLTQPRNRIWTVINGEGSSIYIVAGLHYANRLGYFITEQEWSNKHESFKS